MAIPNDPASFWDNQHLHADPNQITRQQSACHKKTTPTRIDEQTHTGYFKTYETTLNSCTCRDFALRSQPCKHMYRLAHELQVFTLPFPVESSDVVVIGVGKVNQYVDKTTGEIFSQISKDGAIAALDTLSPVSLKILKEILFHFVYRNTNEYFVVNKSAVKELLNSSIVHSLDIDVLSKLTRASKSELLELTQMINSEKISQLNPRSLKKTILKFITTQLVTEVNELEDSICVFAPNSYLQESYTAIYRALLKKYDKGELCYDCYLKKNQLAALDPDTFILSGEDICPSCGSFSGSIRVLIQ